MAKMYVRRWIGAILFAACLCALLLNPLVPQAHAANREAIDAADELCSLGLFRGVGDNADGTPNYDLDRPMTRVEGITMMVRVMGAEKAAEEGTWDIPFRDVPDWALPCVGYAYAHQYTNGTGAETFGTMEPITAAQYITFLLRALGYSSATDFQWDRPWELSNRIGLTDGRYVEANNAGFLRADAAIVSASALDVPPKGGGQTLREALAGDSGDSATPADLDARLLTDDQINALRGKSPEELRGAISTVADAQAYINGTFQGFYAIAALGGSGGYWPFASAEQTLAWGGDIAPNTYATCVTYLLSDDYDIYTVYGLRQECVYYDNFPVKTINCIKTQEGYRFFQSCSMSQVPEDHGGSMDVLLPAAETASLREYADFVASRMDDVTALYAVKGGVAVTTNTDEQGWMVIADPAGAPFYSADPGQAMAEIEDQIFAHAKPENINNYKIASMLGGITLSVEEACALANAEPEAVKDKVKTAGDMLMYMMAARFSPRNGDVQDSIDNHVWHYNWTAEQNIEGRSINCGGGANLANYLLEGDYEEVGFILISYYPGMGGGHVYNYFKYQGDYYIVDYTLYVTSYYGSNPDIRRVHTLEEYGSVVYRDYGGTCLALSHTSPGQHLPNVWEDTYYYVPAGAEYKVLYEASDGYRVGELNLDTEKLNWLSF